MNIVVDENLLKLTVETLRSNGHVVFDLRGTPEQGAEDLEVWNKSSRRKRFLSPRTRDLQATEVNPISASS